MSDSNELDVFDEAASYLETLADETEWDNEGAITEVKNRLMELANNLSVVSHKAYDRGYKDCKASMTMTPEQALNIWPHRIPGFYDLNVDRLLTADELMAIAIRMRGG